MKQAILNRFLVHRAALQRYIRRLTGQKELAEDLTQEVFLRITRGVDRLEGLGRDRAYLYRIARNLYMDDHRRRTRHPEDGGDSAELQLPSRGGSAYLHVSLDQAISRLPEPEREAFLLREVGGLGYGEICGVTGGTEDAVRSRIFRARVALRDMLGTSKETLQ